MVNEEPYCIWEVDLKERKKEFLQSISGDYFRYLIKAHYENATDADDKWAAIALRNGYFHGLETLFSIMGGFLQAPNCMYAWIAKCSTGELRSLVSRVDRKDPTIVTKLNIKAAVSWESISDIVFRYYEPGTEKNIATRKHFANVWRRLAHEFLESHNIEEYNSLKHGFRIKPGGFGISCGIEREPGVPASREEMTTIGQSKYGSSFYLIDKLGKDAKKTRSLKSRRFSVNWEIEKVIQLTQLIAISIDNFSSILAILNGQQANEVKFFRPVDDEDFEKPWTYSSGVNNLSFNLILNESACKLCSKEELLEIIASWKVERTLNG